MEHLRGFLEMTLLVPLVAQLLPELLHLLLHDLVELVFGHCLTTIKSDLMVQPLPDLGTNYAILNLFAMQLPTAGLAPSSLPIKLQLT